MRLTQGQQAPAFATTDLYDAAISSHELKGKKSYCLFIGMRLALFAISDFTLYRRSNKNGAIKV